MDRKKNSKQNIGLHIVKIFTQLFEQILDRLEKRHGSGFFVVVVIVGALGLVLPWIRALMLVADRAISWIFGPIWLLPLNEGTTASIGFVLAALGIFAADRYRRQSGKHEDDGKNHHRPFSN